MSGLAMRLSLVRSLLAIGAIALLAGCNVLRGTPPVTYDLSVPTDMAKIGGGSGAQLLIPEPTALKVMDSDRIVVTSGSRVSYYPDAQWPDRLPKVFQNKAIAAFEQSRKARAVGRPGEGLSIDYQLLTDIRAFSYEVTAEGRVAHVEVFAKVLNDRNGRVAASQLFVSRVPVEKEAAEAVVDGLDQALQAVLVDMVRWTLTRI